ncbi:MAG: class I SAM-dependent methyltransferase [Acidimicrobiia bacterium]
MTGAVDAAVAAFATAPRGVRAHVAVRRRTCPLAEIEARVPRAGRVLDLGCGHGLLSLVLALAGPERRVHAVDVDADKLVHARRAVAAAGLAHVEVEDADASSVPEGPWDAVVVNDVLYLLGAARATALLGALAETLAPGGALLVKEIDVRPRWKFELARAQELVSTRVTRITEGETVEFVPPDRIAGAMRAAGLEVTHVPLHRGRLHPHHLVVGRVPGTGSA